MGVVVLGLNKTYFPTDFMYRSEAKKRNLRNYEPETSIASGLFLIVKFSLLSL